MMLARIFLSLLLAGSLAASAFPDENPLAINPEMKQFVAEKIGFGLAPMQRLQLLVSAIFNDKEMNFAYASVSRSASETFGYRTGNCLSFTLMFISMARYLDLDARFYEVNIPPAFTKRGESVVLIQHLKPVVFIAGGAYAVDIFPAIIPIGLNGEIVADERGLAHFFGNKGIVELGNGNYDLADAYLKKALAVDATAFSAWINMGTLRFRTGKMAEAEHCYRQALALSSKNPAAMHNLANVYERTGRREEAQRLKKKVQQFREKNPYYHYDLGMQAFKQGDFQEALGHYRQAIQLNSSEPVFYMESARTYAKLGKIKPVLDNLKLAVKYSAQSEDKLRYEEKLAAMKSLSAAAEKR
jgi:tetratricopeptide (TPR) repeat protein